MDGEELMHLPPMVFCKQEHEILLKVSPQKGMNYSEICLDLKLHQNYFLRKIDSFPLFKELGKTNYLFHSYSKVK